jgi:hypothetical protein
MANQDFDINIRVNANTAQVDAIRQSFEKLGAQVRVTNAEMASGGGGALGGALGGAPEGDALSYRRSSAPAEAWRIMPPGQAFPVWAVQRMNGRTASRAIRARSDAHWATGSPEEARSGVARRTA